MCYYMPTFNYLHKFSVRSKNILLVSFYDWKRDLDTHFWNKYNCTSGKKKKKKRIPQSFHSLQPMSRPVAVHWNQLQDSHQPHGDKSWADSGIICPGPSWNLLWPQLLSDPFLKQCKRTDTVLYCLYPHIVHTLVQIQLWLHTGLHSIDGRLIPARLHWGFQDFMNIPSPYKQEMIKPAALCSVLPVSQQQY